ncbi:hypothetical protein [Mesorhizobium sp. WSM1293]|uniref:hypothetical protein n=1 Tax=Mesorhizobium sp. WSM1293 TaxID=1040984 RepID=UPI00048931FB|nr:hypothetical protein [Mesorhizobium sp. WSM1293]
MRFQDGWPLGVVGAATLFQGSASFQIGLGIVVLRVEDRTVDARRDEVHGGGMPEGVWRYVLGTQRLDGFGPAFMQAASLNRIPEALSGSP